MKSIENNTIVYPTIAVMGHPSRRDMRADLVERLRFSGDDDAPFACTIVEDDGLGCWATAKRAWQAGIPLRGANPERFHIVVQDDALPCKDFVRAAARALNSVPAAELVSFYWMPDRPRDEPLKDHIGHWLTFNGAPGAVCLAIRAGLIGECLNWIDHNFLRKDNDADDTRLSAWSISTQRKWWACLPSLVDHRGDASVAGHQYPFERRAAKFLGEKKTDTGIKWEEGADNPPHRDVWSASRFLQFCANG